MNADEVEKEKEKEKHIYGRESWSSGCGNPHFPKVVGSNPGTIYWMDIFSHIFVVKIVMFV